MLNKRIIELREKLKISRRQLAANAKVSPEYIYKLENGDLKNPTIKMLRTLAKALNVSVHDLVSAIEHAA